MESRGSLDLWSRFLLGCRPFRFRSGFEFEEIGIVANVGIDLQANSILLPSKERDVACTSFFPEENMPRGEAE